MSVGAGCGKRAVGCESQLGYAQFFTACNVPAVWARRTTWRATLRRGRGGALLQLESHAPSWPHLALVIRRPAGKNTSDATAARPYSWLRTQLALGTITSPLAALLLYEALVVLGRIDSQRWLGHDADEDFVTRFQDAQLL